MIRILSFILFVQLCWLSANAQVGRERIVEPAELAIMIDSIAKLVEQKYIHADMGQKTGDYVKTRFEEGTYDGLSLDSLGRALRTDFLTVSEDVHMNAFYLLQENTPQESMLSSKLDEYGESSNYGYVETRISKDNIGYLKIAHFTKWKFFEQAKQAATNAVKMIQHTDALIIDVRGNPGGFEDIVAHMIAHFFEGEPILLQEYYCRYLDSRNSVGINPAGQSISLPEIPIYILVDYDTGSAGESFAYMMKHLGRAKIIGDTTVGAGNGATYFRVSEEFVVQIATWETINAITKTSWEKVGVIPNIQTSSAAAYDTAMVLAQASRKSYRAAKVKNYERVLEDLDQAIVAYEQNNSDSMLIANLRQCQKLGFFDESSINNMGYQYFGQTGKTDLAEVIFKANTLLYPNSANVYDSYAEGLIANEKYALAVKNYQKAVSLAQANQDPNLALFQENLAKLKAQIDRKP